MEKVETTERNVVLELNGVSVDVDVIIKDAELELNNNEDTKSIDKNANNRASPTVSESLEKIANDDLKHTETTEGSLNTDNGADNEHKISIEGDSKVDLTTGSDDISDVSDLNMSVVASVLGPSQNESDTSDKFANATLSHAKGSSSSSSSEAKTDDTVTAAPSAQSDNESKANNANNSDKSPKKKSMNKKRKNRVRSKKTDYSALNKYTVSVSQRQRRYFLLVARGVNVQTPTDDCEIFCSNIPINVLEGELIPLFERYGKIWELRLMMSMRNPKRNSGFAFVRFTSHEAAQEATEKLNNYEIVPGKLLAVRLSQPNLSLFVGNIHRGLTRDQIHEKISSRTKGLVKTFVKNSLYEDTKNCGFCFLEYDCHSSALDAKHLLNRGHVWGRQLFVDWAQRRKQPDENELNDSKTLFINYLPKETTDQQITESFNQFGEIEKVTKIKDYAFVLFADHDSATNAATGVDKAKLGNEAIEITLAMPKAMKSRPRFSSYPFGNSRRHQRSSYQRYNKPFFQSSNNFDEPRVAKSKTDDGAAGPADDQTVIPEVHQTNELQLLPVGTRTVATMELAHHSMIV